MTESKTLQTLQLYRKNLQNIKIKVRKSIVVRDQSLTKKH